MPDLSDLAADLEKLAAVPDHVLRRAARDAWVREMARSFAVPFAVAELRLRGIGPFLPKEAPNDR